MLLLEHDGKRLLADHHVPVPTGILLRRGEAVVPPSFPAPWMVKAQVPAGGRGKAGGIRRVTRAADLDDAVTAVFCARIAGAEVSECRIEQAIDGAVERYVSLSLDPPSGGVTVILGEAGGVDIEDQPRASLAIATTDPSPDSVDATVSGLAAGLDPAAGAALRDAAVRLARIFFALDLTLLEINPLLVRKDGAWIAADARITFDDGAFPRQPAMRDLLGRRGHAYPAEAFKQRHGFDFVVLDPGGPVGLITTGAGLSMKVVDELAWRGVAARNFCDIRSGMMRGDPARLVAALEQLAAGPGLKAILVNIFAGITDLAEFADLMVTAFRRVDLPSVPIVTRLIGNNEAAAARVLADSGLAVELERDLDAALDRLAVLAGAARA